MARDQARIRQEVLVEATAAVKSAKRKHTVLMINAEARRIFDRRLDCPVPLAELKMEMFRLGVADRLSIDFS